MVVRSCSDLQRGGHILDCRQKGCDDEVICGEPWRRVLGLEVAGKTGMECHFRLLSSSHTTYLGGDIPDVRYMSLLPITA